MTRDQGRRFRVLATSAGFEPGFRGGGPVRSVAAIIDGISDATDLLLITSDRDAGVSEPYADLSGQWVLRGRSRVYYLNTRSGKQWLQLWRELSAKRFDILYVNSLWNPIFTAAPIVAARVSLVRARRILIAPRGELSQGALSLKSLKKRLAIALWRPFLERGEILWHATSELEAADIRAIFPRAQIHVVPNQVSLPYEPIPATGTHEGRTRIVFVGRISPKKNVDLVLAALNRVPCAVDLDIYGPLESADYWSRCQALIRQLPVEVRARYLGELSPTQVRPTFAQYDAFVFPTRGENFGHVIAESLSASCPVICSAETPWTSVLVAGGGAVVHDLNADGVGREVCRFAAMTAVERLSARQAAGNAYRAWRKGPDAGNILELVRLANRSV